MQHPGAHERPGGAWRRSLAALALVAAGALLATALHPSGRQGAPAAVRNPAQVDGILECASCELRERAAADRPSATLLPALAREHAAVEAPPLLELRDDAGTAWTLHPASDDVASLLARENAGRRATVFGYVAPDLHAILVDRLTLW